MKKKSFLFTSESVSEGHPDKVADQISDAVLDTILKNDPKARVACETMVTTGYAVVAGEISTDCYIEIPKIVRSTIKNIGYTHSKMGFDFETLDSASDINTSTKNHNGSVSKNNTNMINNYNIFFKEINEIKKSNYVAIKGNFIVYDEKKNIITKLEPENRYYPITNNFTTEASIHTNLSRDLYIVLGDGNLSEGWVVKIYYNPLVIWIWIGALAIFIGGIISISNNLKKIKILS